MITSSGKLSRLLTPFNRISHHVSSTSRITSVLHYQSTTATAASKAQLNENVKPFDDMPQPDGSMLQRMFFIMRNYKKLTEQGHIGPQEMFKTLGPIFKANNAGVQVVLTADPRAAECMFRAEGKYPKRIDMGPWSGYRRERNLPFGVLLADNEEWKETRSAVDKRMLKLKDVHSYAELMNTVIDDFISYLLRLRGKDGVENEIHGFESQTFRWSLETVLGIIFDKRIGCFENPPDPRGEKFYNAMVNMMEKSPSLFMLPPYYKYIKTKFWKDYCSHWDTMFEVGLEIIRQRKEELKLLATSTQPSDNVDFLTDIIQRSNLSDDRLNTTLIELMLGASDTTANTVTWTLMLLSKYPEKQEKLYREIKSVLKDGERPDAMTVHNAPYLRACIKESMRMYPVVFSLVRQVSEDVVMMGYQVPAETSIIVNLYQLFHNEEYFPEPEKFIPERWIKGEDGSISRAGFKFLPFGFGPRMCIGRRIAELEMHILLARLVQRFVIGCNNVDDVGIVTRITLTPDKPVKLTLTDR